MMDKNDSSAKEGASEKNAAMTDSSTSTYLDYSPQVLADAETAQKSGRKVVLFFYAPWCPYCRAADSDFKTRLGTDAFPKNTTLIKTDYDSQTELKKKYGVTHQHTFVQIDASGNQITKWVSGDSAELQTNIK
jgi:thiol-disulfide isomerase/thioredoxin